MLSAYLLLVGWQSLRPLSVLWVSPANLEPLATIRADLDRGPEAAFRSIGSGMLRLAPLGLLLPLVARRLGGGRFASLVHTVALGALVALILEWSQSLVPSRVSDVDTIILNTAGIALTHQLCYAHLRSFALSTGGHRGWRRRERDGRQCDVLRQDAHPSTPAQQPPLPPHRPPAARPTGGTPTADGAEHPPGADQSPNADRSPNADNRAAPRGVRGAALSR